MIRDIVAVDKAGGMAKAGKTPWNLPADIYYFHVQTKRYGGNLLVGRGSYEAMKKGLIEREGLPAWPPAGRHLYVLTSQDIPDEPNVTIVRSLPEFLANMAADSQDIWNGSVADVEPDEIYLTRIHANYDCDKFYPMGRLKNYHIVSSTPATPNNGEPNYTYEIYVKNP